VACIDVIIPTYRCDLRRLRALCTLACSHPASVQTLIVVDRPNTPNLAELRALACYAADRTVRVHVQEANAGASFARNTGLAQSFGDYAVLLDDDVVPGSWLR
jgi:glycosyltransferase involved in cell wall biosynthesis